MDGGALQLTLRELHGHLKDPRALAIMAVIGVVLGFAGPFGTFETLPLAGRIAYWVATVFVTYVLGFGISIWVDTAWGAGKPLWLRTVLMIVPAGLGATVVVVLLNLAVFGGTYLSPDAILTQLAQCFSVAAAVVIVSVVTEQPALTGRTGTESGPAEPAPSSALAAEEDAAQQAPIFDRVPHHLRGALVALLVEDHYVDIVTARGKTLVLMRLADAIRETGSIAGLQIHRSHWVARDAIVRIERRDGRVMVEMSNGMTLPVSRGYLQAVKDAGLI